MFDMKKQLEWSKLKVGTVITFAFITLFLAVFFAGGIEGIFSPESEIKAAIHDVKGLRKGAPVWISGIEVGSVKSINLNPESGTTVTLSVNKSALKYIKKDSQASVLTMGLLGDKYVEMTTGSPGSEPIKTGDMIKGAAQLELKDVLAVSTESIQKMSDFIKKLESLVTMVEQGEGTVSKFLHDPAIYDNLRETTKNLSLLSKDMEKSQGSLRMLLKDPSLYNKMLAASSSFEEFGKKLNDGSGTIKKLVEDPSLYNRLLAASSSIEDFSKKLNEGNGTLRRLAEDAQLYENLSKASSRLSSILERIDEGEGVAGSLVRDDEFARDLKETIAELKELTKDIKEHPMKYFNFKVF